MNIVQRGFRSKIEEFFDINKNIVINISVDGKNVFDTCCFGLDTNDKLKDDHYMVFYNQKTSPKGEIVFENIGNNSSSFTFNLSKLPSHINKIAFTISIDGEGLMSHINALKVNLSEKKGVLSSLFSSKDKGVLLELKGSDFADEKALIAVEIYRKDVWRMAIVAAGFKGGLSALLKHYGGEEVDAAKMAPPSAPAKVSLEKRLAEKAPELVSLAKPLTLSLEKNKLTDTIARVGLVMDISGSMSGRFSSGAVQAVVNKTIPLAVQFDDDGELDFWYYGSRCKRMPSVNMGNYKTAVPSDWSDLMSKLGYGNNEPAVMKDVIKEYSDSKLPVYILFITDGGVSYKDAIEKLMIESSRKPIFWQFIGLGGSGYGVLEHLDKMSGRYIDNANFFALDDFKTVKNEVLYDRLLNEFPIWLKEAKSKKILK
jgi:stress response protein SCP2